MQELRAPIFAPMITQLVDEGRDLLRQLVESEQAAQVRRMEVGRFLVKARGLLPKRGTPQDGWGHFLEAIELDEATAWRYMKIAEASVGFTAKDADKIPTYKDLGLDKRTGPELPETPAPRDEDAPAELLDTPVKPPDRGAWCTPKDWAEHVGPWDGDPFSNPRSHIESDWRCMLETGGDGFGDPTKLGSYRLLPGADIRIADKKTRIWLQPDYGFVLPAIEHYGHTRFCALLRLDTSTEWFEKLWSLSEVIMIPRGTRLEFEPPPGVEASRNPYPHGLYYKRRADVTKEVRSRCFEWRVSK